MEFLGLEFADAIVARTVGGRVTAAVIQDVAYIGYVVETKAPEGPYFEAAIIHHTDSASRSGQDALLSGSLPDHSALYGVIHQLEVLGLQLREVRCESADSRGA